MSYKLTVIKYDKNENYETEYAQFMDNTRSGFNGFSRQDKVFQEPPLDKQVRVLEVVLNDEEYKTLKGSIIKIFE